MHGLGQGLVLTSCPRTWLNYHGSGHYFIFHLSACDCVILEGVAWPVCVVCVLFFLDKDCMCSSNIHYLGSFRTHSRFEPDMLKLYLQNFSLFTHGDMLFCLLDIVTRNYDLIAFAFTVIMAI